MKSYYIFLYVLLSTIVVNAQQTYRGTYQVANSNSKSESSKFDNFIEKHFDENSIFQHVFTKPIPDSTKPNDGIIHYAKEFNLGHIACSDGGDWKCIGPTGRPEGRSNSKGAGQIHVLKFSPKYTSDKTIYAGTNFGGVWKKIGDQAWESLNTDNQLPVNSVSDLVIDPTDKQRIYISTGDAEMLLGHNLSKEAGVISKHTPIFTCGMYRTVDGGLHWESMNGKDEALLNFFKNGAVIRKIIMHPFDSKILFIATSEGVFKTKNARDQYPVWEKISNDFDDNELKGLEFKPNNPKVIYTSGQDIYRSMDGGDTWNSMTGRSFGLDLKEMSSKFTVYRINIATTKADADLVYAYIVGKYKEAKRSRDLTIFLYRFDGKRWQELHSPKRQDGSGIISVTRTAIIASPYNKNEVYFGTTKVYGGKDVTQKVAALSPYVGNQYHADVHAFAFEPWTKNLFVGTDGGIHIKDLRKTNTSGWTDISDGLQVATTYKFDHVDNGTERIIIGNQDTGTYVYEDGKWEIIAGGDGFNGEVDGKSGIAFFSNHDDDLATYDFNKKKFGRTERRIGAKYEKRYLPKEPDGKKVKIRGVFNALNHPKSEKMIFTMSELYERQIEGAIKSKMKSKEVWKVVSDIGKAGYPTWKRQFQIFDISPSNPDYILTAIPGTLEDIPPRYNEGFMIDPVLFRSTTGGCDGVEDYKSKDYFTDITQNLIKSGIKCEQYVPLNKEVKTAQVPIITGIVFHPENHLKAWITFTGYEPGIEVWATEDGGDTWFNADSTGSLHNLPIHCITYEYGSDEMLYIGTDAGIFYKDATMKDWMKFCDFPNVRVTDLNINYCMGVLRASTFGRSLWEGNLMGKKSSLGEIELEIDEETTWDFDRGLDRNLRIKSGARLTIRGTLENPTIFSMPKHGKIIVEPGATLRIIHASVTNNCDQNWDGIQIWGDSTYCQVPEYQGYLYMQNAVIENAKVGIFIGHPVDESKAGGIVNAYKSVFRKNKQNTMSMQYSNPSSPNRGYETATSFEGCVFE